jgi:ketosteroid isomerase-like protein
MSVDLQRLEERIRALEDIEAIRHLRMTYHHYTNEGMYDRIGDLYTEDAYVEFDTLANARGEQNVRALLLKLNGSVTLIKQFIGNHMVTLNGDSASGISYLDARYVQDGKPVIAAVRYADKYRRTADGWKMSEMLVKIFFCVPISVGWAGEKLQYMKPVSEMA